MELAGLRRDRAQGVKKRRNIEAIVGHTRAWRHIAETWQPNDPAAILQPDHVSNQRGLGGVRAPIPMDSNSQERTWASDNLPWADHVLNGERAWRAPWRLQAAVVMVQSGSWSSPNRHADRAGSRGRSPDGTAIERPNGVERLATRIPFAYPTRGERQLHAPMLTVWNLRLGACAAETGRVA